MSTRHHLSQASQGEDAPTPPTVLVRIGWIGAGILVLVGAGLVARAWADARGATLGLAVAALGYILALVLIKLGAVRLSATGWLFALAVSLVARGLLIAAPPVLEDDVYRYMWDGAVTRSGESPFRFSPQEVMDRRLDRPFPARLSSGERERIDALAELSRTPAIEAAFLRINYPSVPTIYPPAVQGIFATVDAVGRGRVWAMKLAFTLLELAAAAAIAWGLRVRNQPREWLVAFLWSPLLLVSFAGAAHMDALPMAAVALSLTALLAKRPLLAGAALGVAIGAKLFALVLVPLLARRLGWRGLLIAAATVAASYAPYLNEPRLLEGLQTYAATWRFNSAGFGLLAMIIDDRTARIVAGVLVAGIAVAAAWRLARVDILSRTATVLATLVLLAPAVNPWYVAWLAPLVAWTMTPWLIALSIGVLGYYAHFLPGGAPAWLPWVEFAPAALLLLAALTRRTADSHSLTLPRNPSLASPSS